MCLSNQSPAAWFELIYRDPLTGLPNRRRLHELLQQALQPERRLGIDRYAALLFLVIDDFKAVKDTHGQNVGDMLVTQVAERISDSVGASDCVAHVGGDEFAVLFERLGPEAGNAAHLARLLGENMRRRLNETYALGSLTHRTSASFGIAVFTSEGRTADDVMRQADMAMAHARRAGRNGMRMFDPAMEVRLSPDRPARP